MSKSPREIIDDLLEYAVRFAEINEEPSDGGCWDSIEQARQFLAASASSEATVAIPQSLWQSAQTALMNASVDLNDASSVVDASKDEEYAYQDTLELLKDVRDRIDAHAKEVKHGS